MQMLIKEYLNLYYKIQHMRNLKVSVLLFFVSLIFLTLVEWQLDYPLNDESVYARAVNVTLTTGKLGCEGCTASALFLVLYGTLISTIFGYSLTILRLGAIFLGATGIALTYFLLTKFGAKRKIASLISLLLLVNPVYYSTSRLFMTDIIFFVLALLAVIFYEIWQGGNKLRYFAAACVVSMLAVLTRQIGLLLPMAFAIVSFASKRKLEAKHFALLAIPFLAFAGFSATKFLESGTFYEGGLDVRNPIGFSQDGVYAVWGSLTYLGFLLLPFSILGLEKIIKMDKRMLFFTLTVATVAILLNAFIAPQHPIAASMPYLPNALNMQGIGALTLLGADEKPVMFNESFWLIVTIFTLISTASVITDLSRPKKSNIAMILLALLLTFALLKRGVYFDRYVLLLMPLAASLLHNNFDRKITIGTTAIVIILFGFLSFYGTSEYMTWNSVRWNAIAELQNETQPENINGGFEYCFYNFGYEPLYSYWKQTDVFNSDGVRHHNWKFCKGDDYVVSFSESPTDFKREWNYTTYKSYSYCTALNYCGKIYVLKAAK